MASRLLRDYTNSSKVDTLSFQAEVLFVRLMMKADDYGSFHANPKLINSYCFPLKNIRETDISRWLQELVSAGLIVAYTAESKEYVRICDFGQRLRAMKNRFPEITENQSVSTPVQNSPQFAATRRNSPPEEKGREVEEEEEVEGQSEPLTLEYTHSQIEAFEKFQNWINTHASNVAKLKEPFTIKEYLQIAKKHDPKIIRDVLQAMHNRKDLLKKYNSAYLTANNWAKTQNTSKEGKDNDLPKTDKRIIEKLKDYSPSNE